MTQLTASRRGAAVSIAALTALVLLVALGAWLWTARDGRTAPEGLGVRTASAGEVEVTMTALTLDRGGAKFKVAFDTHTVELDTDLPDGAQLRINGALAPDPAAWNGDGPGGHHREGTLTFRTAVPPRARVQLRITGLPEPATGTWTAP